ncbi:hypothetical protein [Haloarchaeobius sp. TZWWS8]|uniref:hypothetical protein n=1 Tax=Haloarchaeobius sp. TZWWS8 TaxID=3446121 RepID=UPI003EBA0098
MTRRITHGIVRELYNAVFNPSRFVRAQTSSYTQSRVGVVVEANRLVVVYVLNLLLYAVPLTLAGVGVQKSQPAPDWFAASAFAAFADPNALWQFWTALLDNCSFITVALVITFLNYHAAVALSLSSKGVLQTMHTVVYTTSAYLAAIFTLVMHLSTSPTIQVADQIVINVQKSFFYFFIDALGSGLALPSGRPTPVDMANVTLEGKLAIAGLVISLLYYLYSLYLGARLNHGTTRTTAFLVIGAVGAAPAIYVVGIIVANTNGMI